MRGPGVGSWELASYNSETQVQQTIAILSKYQPLWRQLKPGLTLGTKGLQLSDGQGSFVLALIPHHELDLMA